MRISAFPWNRAAAAGIPSFRTLIEIRSSSDRDRIIHRSGFSKAGGQDAGFRRRPVRSFPQLRLTHTIEVSQIARTVAGVLGLDEDLTEALALGHDIGHPPFAHSGEAQLDLLMRQFGARFDHNLHALRIVESFESPYARFPN